MFPAKVAAFLLPIIMAGAVACRAPTADAMPTQERDFTHSLPQIMLTIVLVEVPPSHSPEVTSRGSGVRISPNEILTARHVMGTQTTATVLVKGEGRVSARVVGYDTKRDVALLTFENKSNGPAVSVAGLAEDNGYSLGREVAIVAYAPTFSQVTPIATFGRIGAIWHKTPGGVRQGQVDAVATGGMSGGGVFTSRGEFLGMVVGTNLFGMVTFLTASEINEVIQELRAGVKNPP